MSDFLETIAGQGLGDISAGEVKQPYLSILQATSEAVSDGEGALGHFFNSATREDYGPELIVVTTGFKSLWAEVDAETGKTIQRYLPGAIEIRGDLYKDATCQNGNRIVESWVYQFVLPNHSDMPFLIFASSPGTMKVLRAWNTQMKFLLLPSGKPAPIFASIWQLAVTKTKNKNDQPYFTLAPITRAGWVDEDLYKSHILPARQHQLQQLALSAPAAFSDSDTIAIEASSY